MPSTEVTPIGTLLASLPAMLGYVPTESVVLLPFLASEHGHVLGRPTLHVKMDDVAEAPHAMGRQLSEFFTDLPLTQLLVVLTTSHDHGPTEERPFRTEITGLLNALRDEGITKATVVMASHFAENANWYRYDDPTIHGTLPDPSATVAAARAAAAGRTIAASRDELDARFTPADPTDRERLAPVVNLALIAFINAHRMHGTSALADRLAALDDAARAAGEGRYPGNDADIATLIVSLANSVLRDAMLDPGDNTDVAATENLAQFLWRLAPDPYAGRIAAFIAALAYQRADATYAQTALKWATPSHTFAQLLTGAIHQVIPPEQLRQICRRSAQEIRRDLQTADPT